MGATRPKPRASTLLDWFAFSYATPQESTRLRSPRNVWASEFVVKNKIQSVCQSEVRACSSCYPGVFTQFMQAESYYSKDVKVRFGRNGNRRVRITLK